MAALTFDALLKGLKPTGGAAPNPVYYLHGEEDVLKEEAVRALLERAVDPAARDFNLDTRAAADLDPEALRALVDTPPLLAERRAVVLRGIEQLNKKKGKTRDELLRYLDNPNPSTVLILIQGEGEADADLATPATAVQGARLSPNRPARCVAQRPTRSGLKRSTCTAVARVARSASASPSPWMRISTVLGLGLSRYRSSSSRVLPFFLSCSMPRSTTARRSASRGGVSTSARSASGSRSAAARVSRLKSRAAGSTARSSSARTASSFSTSSSPWR